ncbi:unnamed protein product [Owenia fusiformis]|uniref:Uncharacterized protein n=1 Tax=Owenia fusiformis TaxID=6347 RepID=A0A8J1XPD3_OWEFU|nr:unnamed protein product [Owenia fusiformis]
MRPEKGTTQTSMEEEVLEGSDLFKWIGMLVLEARVPQMSPKGRTEGPHCPGILGEVTHACDNKKNECVEAVKVADQMEQLWQNNVPMCIEVLLHPDCKHGREMARSALSSPLEKENVIVLEQWTIQVLPKRCIGNPVSASMVMGAVRSYLYFSQISAWLNMSKGAAPRNLAYRISAPGEYTETYWSETQLQQSHTFPGTVISKTDAIKVSVISRPRCPTIPAVLCKDVVEAKQDSHSGKSSPRALSIERGDLSDRMSPKPAAQERSFSPKLWHGLMKPEFEPKTECISHGSPHVDHDSPKSTTPYKIPTMQNQKRFTQESSHSIMTSQSQSSNTTVQTSNGRSSSSSPTQQSGSSLRPSPKTPPASTSTPQSPLTEDIISKMKLTGAVPKHYKLLHEQHQLTSSDIPLQKILEKDVMKKQAPIELKSPTILWTQKSTDQVYYDPKNSPIISMNAQYEHDLAAVTSKFTTRLLQPLSSTEMENYLADLKQQTPGHRPFYARNLSSSSSSSTESILESSCDSISSIKLKVASKHSKVQPNKETTDCQNGSIERTNTQNGSTKCQTNSIVEIEAHTNSHNNMIPCSSKSVSNGVNKTTLVSSPCNISTSEKDVINGVNSSINGHDAKDISQISSPAKSRIHEPIVGTKVIKTQSPKTVKGFLDSDSSSNNNSPRCNSILSRYSSNDSIDSSPERSHKHQSPNGALRVKQSPDRPNVLQLRRSNSHEYGHQQENGHVKHVVCHDNAQAAVSHDESHELNTHIQCYENVQNGVSPLRRSSLSDQLDSTSQNGETSQDNNDTLTESIIEDPHDTNKIKFTLDNEDDDNVSEKDDITESMQVKTDNETTNNSISNTNYFQTPKPNEESKESKVNRKLEDRYSPQSVTHFVRSPTDGVVVPGFHGMVKSLSTSLLRSIMRKDNSAQSVGDGQVDSIGRRVPSAQEKATYRKSVDSSSNIIFHHSTGLPMQSSPAPMKKRTHERFEYDHSLNTVKSIKSAISMVTLDTMDSNGNTTDNNKVFSTSAPACTTPNCLLGNFEESLLNGRIDPVGTVSGFTAEIGASGAFCPKHLELDVTAFFFNLSDDNAPSPYLGHINIEAACKRRGYHVPKLGTLQVTLFNPNKKVVKMFVVRYDLTDMPPNSQTFLRQRTIYQPVQHGNENSQDLPTFLRYLIHLRFCSSKSNKIYLHTDIRLIFARDKFEFDPRVANYELRSYTEGPTNPQFSPKR